MDVPQGVTFLTQGIVKAIVAIAEMGPQGEDRLSAIATETLAEIRNSASRTGANCSGDGHASGYSVCRVTTTVTDNARRSS